jgi:hypothetical protein
MQKIFGWAAIALLLASMAVAFWSRTAYRPGLGLGVAAMIVVLLLTLSTLGKRRAARDPEFADRLAEATADATIRDRLQARQQRYVRALKILVPTVLLSLPVWYGLHAAKPDTPMLQGLIGADLERLALAGGLILTLMGYGLRWLVRRGDSGNG